jgi:methylenetetrahydrofolate--tRNA-(uracil-5-)-methyltransferase
MSIDATVVGGGLAGCEAAVRMAERGLRVRLFEMRPVLMTPAHRTGNLAELVCSSSLKSNSPQTAHGLLKEEMRRLGSVVLQCAEQAAVPGGDALCVDRDRFAEAVTGVVEAHPNIEVVRAEVREIPSERPCVIATGPLTSPALTRSITSLTGARGLHFFDAIAPSVDAESIDHSKVFRQSRYDKGGEPAYINCPMSREEYEAFIDTLTSAKIAHLHLEEERDTSYFEGCLPVEVMAKRGRDTLAHGMMKPVGLTDPRTGRRPWAVVQLRQENAEGSVYGLVGFQTQLRPSEQERVFRMIPGLEHAQFVRFGAVHRNTYIDSPNVLDATLMTKPPSFLGGDGRGEGDLSPSSLAGEGRGEGATCRCSANLFPKRSPLAGGAGVSGTCSRNGLYFAGQLIGVEGYMESAATGIIAGINAARIALGEEPVVPPKETMIGALLEYVANCPVDDFQPMNSNFGIFPPLDVEHKKRDRKEMKLERARRMIVEFLGRL